MARHKLVLAEGGSRKFAIAGIVVGFHSEIEGFQLPWSYAPFEITENRDDISVEVRSLATLEPAPGQRLYDSRAHWRVLEGRGGLLYELSHPPSGHVFARMRVDEDHARAELTFSEALWRRFRGDETPELLLPYPLDQLLLVPHLAARGGLLLHASGAVLGGGALVFPGHSGAGKTTLARLLREEGLELLSDERVALVREGGSFTAYGTPWPGEGDIVSISSYPLRSIYLLNKAPEHAIRYRGSASLVPELLARAIAPYYHPATTKQMLALLPHIARQIPLRELCFARAPGLRTLLDTAA